jgi:hypothetical protein
MRAWRSSSAKNLLTNLPDGYKVGYQNRNDKELISEMVPQNETVENWTEMVTVQIFFGQKTGPANSWHVSTSSGWRVARGGEPRSLYDGLARGYATAMWVLVCPLNPATKKPEITWFKAVQGNDSLLSFRRHSSSCQLRNKHRNGSAIWKR